MTAVFSVAQNTFRQTVRQRLFLNVVVFGVGMVLVSMVVGQITFGFPDRVVRSIGLSGVAIAVDLMAILVAVSLIHEEIDRKTLFVLLTRPMHRWQYVLGRYLGLLFALTVALAGFAIIFFVVLQLAQGVPSVGDLYALAAVLPEAAVLGAFGLVLSAFSTPTLSAGIGLGFWIASASTDDLVRLSAKADEMTHTLAQVVYYALPSLARFNFREAAIYQQAISGYDFGMAALYGGLYAAGLLALASLILSRREMV